MDAGRTTDVATPSAGSPDRPSDPLPEGASDGTSGAASGGVSGGVSGSVFGGVFGGVGLEARDLGVRGAHGWVYRHVSLHAAPGTLTVVTGEAGSGRTSLLLTLAGRMKPTEGTLTVGGLATPRRIRRVAALGLFPEVNPFDDALTVREHLQERMRPRGFLWRGRHPDAARSALAHAGLDPHALPQGDRTPARELTRDQAVRLGVALALLDRPGLLLVDDAGTGIPAGRRRELWDVLRGLAGQGLTVVATCTDAEEATGAATTLLPLPVPAPPAPGAGDEAARRDEAETGEQR
ncbi:ABC transporter ATP-binding protein [Microbispora hainanensis]|uniref:ATP-binding cassette domain-containing protein n=1 Tax=Microbispora hainanensis TaxID=568844 RepID=A0A544Y2E1_9ACTN|nr:ATP-binding cassette domain-containing protein [Microbispora hainanensis]TQS10930.1 ATP-binding cassette domain-containing protein [Microbispora hainanensis]